MQEKENILKILEGTKASIQKGDTVTIKNLSNQTTNTAALTHDPDNIAIAVIVYSISKLLERQDYQKLPGWKEFHDTIFKCIDKTIIAIKSNDEVKIKEEKVNFYKVLGLKSDASTEEIRNSYFNYAKKFHPDRITTAPDPGINEKANFVFSEINRAYDTLSDDDKKRQYDMDKITEKGTEGSSLDKSLERASLLHRKAKTLFNQKNFWEATTLLEESVRLNPKRGAYYLLLGMSQMNIPTMIRAAEKNLSNAVDLDPWSAEPLVALGILFLNENMVKRAENFFRKAISIDPENKIAKKRLADIIESSSKGKLKNSIFKKK